MKLREPRIAIPESTYAKDMFKLFHPLMLAPILMLVTIGTFLAPQLNLIRFILELIGVFFAVLCAYHIDEFWEKVTAPNVPKQHNGIIALTSLLIALIIGGYLFITVTYLLWIPTIIAFFGILLYNADVPYFKNRFVYALSWGGCPIFGSYMVQTGTWPNLTVIVFTIFGMLLSVKLFWNWSLRTCGRIALCPEQKVSKGYCHSPNTIWCFDRLQMPKEVNNTMKILQRLELLILFTLMIGVILT